LAKLQQINYTLPGREHSHTERDTHTLGFWGFPCFIGNFYRHIDLYIVQTVFSIH